MGFKTQGTRYKVNKNLEDGLKALYFVFTDTEYNQRCKNGSIIGNLFNWA
jgi:hypothetical protein